MDNETEGTSPGPATLNNQCPGKLIPLKTTLETRAQESLVDVYITSIPVKQASRVLDTIRKLVPNDGGLDLQHLRRFAKWENLPEQLQLSLPCAEESKEKGELFLIIGSTSILPAQAIQDGLSPTIPDLTVFTIPVPLLAPTTSEQAKLWSMKYWPTVYKKSNPFGPHTSLVSRAADDISGDFGRWMELAAAVADETKAEGYGEAFGVVVVERRNGHARPIAVAGDARWHDWHFEGTCGNVTAHAVMRAIGMVAEGLRAREMSKNSTLSQPVEAEVVEVFRDTPLLETEKKNYDTSDNENGYLCFDLEIYCTHEPCVMCSMAIVHSRFGRLVFGKRMRRTGGICAEEDGLGCGLWWRKELNWTMLAWQHVADGEADGTWTDSALHA